jgi:hypothetical protein
MSKETLSNKPKQLKVKSGDAASWFYEEPNGLELIVETTKKTSDGREYKDHIHIIIPWRTIQASIRRYQA